MKAVRKRLGPNDEDGKLTPEEEELNKLLGLDQQLTELNEAQQSDNKLYKELLSENNNGDLPEDEILRRRDEIALIQKRIQERADMIKKLRGTIKEQRKKRPNRNQRNKNFKQQKPSEKEYDL